MDSLDHGLLDHAEHNKRDGEWCSQFQLRSGYRRDADGDGDDRRTNADSHAGGSGLHRGRFGGSHYGIERSLWRGGGRFRQRLCL